MSLTRAPRERLWGAGQGDSLRSRLPGEAREILESTLQQGLHADWILLRRVIAVLWDLLVASLASLMPAQ